MSADLVARGRGNGSSARNTVRSYPENSSSATVRPGTAVAVLGGLYVVLATLSGFGAGLGRPRYRYLALAVAVAMVVLGGRAVIGRVRAVPSVFLYLAWTTASWAWSASRSDTLLDVRTNTTMIAAMLVVASALPLGVLLHWHVRAFQLCAALTFLVLAVRPSSRLLDAGDPGAGVAWRGGFIHKNDLATFAAFALIWALAYSRSAWGRRATCCALLVLVVGSRSATGLIAVFAGSVVWWGYGRLQARQGSARVKRIVLATPLLLALLYASVALLPRLAAGLGKDLTLTGRTLIWRQVVDAAGQRFFEGYGVGAFFGSGGTHGAAPYVQRVGFYFTHAHNGWLQLEIDTGLVGVLLVGALVFGCLADAYALRDRAPGVSRWLFTSVMVVLVTSASEITLTGAGWLSALVVLRVTGIRVREAVESGPSGRMNDLGQELPIRGTDLLPAEFRPDSGSALKHPLDGGRTRRQHRSQDVDHLVEGKRIRADEVGVIPEDPTRR